MSNTLSRIKEYIDYKGISVRKFEESVGFSNGSFASQYKNDKTIGVDKVENILRIYRDISTEWLLTGYGSMLKEEIPVVIPFNKLTEGIPLIPISAFAGAFTGEMQVLEHECEHYVVPTFKGADFLIPVKGSSMYPKYSSGDIVACKRLTLDTFFQWNKVYVLDTDQGALIKRIKQGSSDDTVLVVSENKEYPPFELNRSHIYNIAIVLGVIRLE